MSHSTEWKGSYYDGRSLVPQPVTIRVEPTGLTLRTSNGTTWLWAFHELRQTHGRYSGEEVRLERGSGIGETLVIPNANILLAIHHYGGQRAKHFHHPGSRRKRVYWTIGAAVASIPIIYGIFTWGIPWLTGPITEAIPLSWETQLGQFVQQEFTAKEPLCQHPELTQAIDSIMGTLTKPLEDLPYTFHVTVVDSSVVNAMAAPGGYLIVYRGLLQDTDTPEEFAGVLAHEIQHVLLRHGMRLIVQHVSMAFIIAALSGDVSGIASYGLQSAQMLQTLSYSRDAENQADEQGLNLLEQAGVNPHGMLTFFTKLGKERSGDSLFRYLSTHPGTEDRLSHLAGLITSNPDNYHGFALKGSWADLRKLCDVPSARPNS